VHSPGLVYYRSIDLGMDFCLGLDLAMLLLLSGCAKIRFELIVDPPPTHRCQSSSVLLSKDSYHCPPPLTSVACPLCHCCSSITSRQLLSSSASAATHLLILGLLSLLSLPSSLLCHQPQLLVCCHAAVALSSAASLQLPSSSTSSYRCCLSATAHPLKTKYKYWQNKLFLQIHYFVSNKQFIGTIW
jgi:hypothetical protein